VLVRHCQLLWPLAQSIVQTPGALSLEGRAAVGQRAAAACGGEAEALGALDLALELARAWATRGAGATWGSAGGAAAEAAAVEAAAVEEAATVVATAASGVAAFSRVACAVVDLMGLHRGAAAGRLRVPLAAVRQSPALMSAVGAWAAHAARQDCDVAARVGDAPSLARFELAVLPPSYTDLHCDLVQQLSDTLSSSGQAASDKGEVRPALCLLCGAVLDANGRGQCTAHAAACGHGSGVFFLLQECVVVLLHGTRAAYLPAPYVDRHGEKHGQFRGRPLHLDPHRLHLLRSLVALHEVRHTPLPR
jgi:hypothetical protein